MITVLNAYPDEVDCSEGELINNASIVLRMEYNHKSVLFTGDIQASVETKLVEDYGSRLSSTVLKVAHHGSAYSTTLDFLDMVKPKIAYISVGKNKYGHPAPSTIERLEDAGVTIYRTDSDGTCEYSISDK
jgi:competence protein ComEC